MGTFITGPAAGMFLADLGADGSAQGRPSFDTVAQAASGFSWLLLNPENPRAELAADG